MLQLRPSAAKQILSLCTKNPPANAGDACSVPGSKRSSGEGNGYPHPVLLPGESHRQRNLAGYNPWVAKSRTQRRMHAIWHASVSMPALCQVSYIWCSFEEVMRVNHALPTKMWKRRHSNPVWLCLKPKLSTPVLPCFRYIMSTQSQVRQMKKET